MIRQIKLLLAPVFLFVAALSVCRLYLYLKYHALFAADISDTAFAFVHGVRFDISSSFSASFPFLLALFVPMVTASARRTKLVLYALVVWQIILLGYNFSDIHFYADTQRHLGYDILYARKAIGAVLMMGVKSFLTETIIFGGFLCLYSYVYIRIINVITGAKEGRTFGFPSHAVKTTALLLIFLVVSLIAVRGGVQAKPINVGTAFFSENESIGNLSLNGIYTTAQVFFQYFDSNVSDAGAADLDEKEVAAMIEKITPKNDELVDPEYPFYKKFRYKASELRKMNVVVFIMESWTAKFMKSLGGETGATPNFDRLAGEGLLLENCFANGQRTYDGVLATLGSFPTWNNMIIGYSGLAYQTRLKPVGVALKNLGYETWFIHGARRDTLGLDKLVKRLGISNHISIEDMGPEEKYSDGVWGLYDEAAFLEAHRRFEKMKEPFFAVVLSLTSHLPFNLPSKKFDKFENYKSPMRDFLNAFSYSDYALGKFFEKAKQSSYYKDTLFVILGDHVAGYFTTKNLYEAYRIPCLFINAKAGLSGVYKKTASQFDIVPTILDILRASETFTAWGKSIFSSGERVAVLSRGNSQVFVDESHMLRAQGEKIIGLYDYAADPKKNLKTRQSAKAKRLYKEMKTYMNLSENLILQNKARPPAPK